MYWSHWEGPICFAEEVFKSLLHPLDQSISLELVDSGKEVFYPQ